MFPCDEDLDRVLDQESSDRVGGHNVSDFHDFGMPHQIDYLCTSHKTNKASKTLTNKFHDSFPRKSGKQTQIPGRSRRNSFQILKWIVLGILQAISMVPTGRWASIVRKK